MSNSIKLFQINEQDLAELEKLLPILADLANIQDASPLMRKRIHQVKRIVSDVRWNYGPYSAVETIPFEGGPDDPASPDN